jgi:hypothetical protein
MGIERYLLGRGWIHFFMAFLSGCRWGSCTICLMRIPQQWLRCSADPANSLAGPSVELLTYSCAFVFHIFFYFNPFFICTSRLLWCRWATCPTSGLSLWHHWRRPIYVCPIVRFVHGSIGIGQYLLSPVSFIISLSRAIVMVTKLLVILPSILTLFLCFYSAVNKLRHYYMIELF